MSAPLVAAARFSPLSTAKLNTPLCHATAAFRAALSQPCPSPFYAGRWQRWGRVARREPVDVAQHVLLRVFGSGAVEPDPVWYGQLLPWAQAQALVRAAEAHDLENTVVCPLCQSDLDALYHGPICACPALRRCEDEHCGVVVTDGEPMLATAHELTSTRPGYPVWCPRHREEG